jgi:DNA-binding transcriptional regulator YiaG
VGAVRRRITRYKIEKKVLETDRRRVYVSYDDVITLAQTYPRKRVTSSNIPVEQRLFTRAEAARYLHVSRSTIISWMVKHNIVKKREESDDRLVYLSYDDLMLLAREHQRKLVKKDDLVRTRKQDNGQQEERKLYTVAEAAAYLNTTPSSIIRWMKSDNIEKKFIETDRRRIYIAYKDVILLGEKHRERRIKKQQVRTINPGNNDEHGQQLYTIDEIALFLNVSKSTMKKWIAQYNVNKTIIVADRKRTYVSYNDIVVIAQKHHYEIPKNDSSDIATHQENEQRLYTIAESALFMNISEGTLRNWIDAESIQKIVIASDRVRVYIAYEDIVWLADEYGRRIPDIDPTGFAVEVKKMSRELGALISKVRAELGAGDHSPGKE